MKWHITGPALLHILGLWSSQRPRPMLSPVYLEEELDGTIARMSLNVPSILRYLKARASPDPSSMNS
jgi:hypothetical protein